MSKYIGVQMLFEEFNRANYNNLMEVTHLKYKFINVISGLMNELSLQEECKNFQYDKTVAVSDMTANEIILSCFSIIRADRFTDGLLDDYIKNGTVVKWLEQLANYIL